MTRNGLHRAVWMLAVLLAATFAGTLEAHEIRPAYLQIDETGADQYAITWRTPLNAGMRLPVLLQLPKATRNVSAPTVQELTDSLVERHLIHVDGGLAGKRIEFVGLQATITDVLVRVHFQDGRSGSAIVRPSQAWFELTATPGGWGAAGTFVAQGIRHILFGADHLLFVLGLLLIVKDRWTLIKTVTAFTLAHSITLALATLGYASMPVAPLNAAIALSILFLGPEIVRVWRGETSFTIRNPWAVAFAFGLLHGFGFASALTGSGLPRSELPLALLNFNVGVEIGQLGFVLLVLLVERAFRILSIQWPRWVAALPGYTVGCVGAFWTIQRFVMLLGRAP